MEYDRYSPDIDVEKYPHLKNVTKIWVTADRKYEILFDKIFIFRHLRIRRLDDKPIYDWMDIQEMKNDLFGNDTIAINIHPRQRDFVDGSNTYHIWTWNNLQQLALPNLKRLYKYRNETNRNETN